MTDDTLFNLPGDPLVRALTFKRGDLVKKTGGDYCFYGTVVCVFHKLDEISTRYCVENADGVLHIFNGAQLQHIVDRPFSGGLVTGLPEKAAGGAEPAEPPSPDIQGNQASALNSPGG